MRFDFDKFFYFASIVLLTLTALFLLDLLGDFNPLRAVFSYKGVEFVSIANLISGGRV